MFITRAVLILWFAVCSSAQQPPPASLGQKLQEIRFDLHLNGGRFSGAGAPVLVGSISEAKYVLIGEDHLTREIPEFTAAVCDLMGSQGFSRMIVEASPGAASFVASLLPKPDRLAQMATLLHEYPDSMAFLNIRQENDLVAHCAQSAHSADFRLLGLDQPFIGSAGWLLDQILDTHPGREARDVLLQLKQQEQLDAARARESGDPEQLFLVSVNDSTLVHAAAVLQGNAGPAANALLKELMESRDIYRKNLQGHAVESNGQRARMLKRNLRQDLENDGTISGKVLVKFGNSHLYKGFNELNQRDLGNYIAEMADASGVTSLHICVLGARGVHLLYGGYNRPGKLEPFTLDEEDLYPWLKPAVQNQTANAWTLYDLRKLRFQKIADITPQFNRLIYGYDFLIVIPELTAADPINPL